MLLQNEAGWQKVLTTAATQAGWEWLHIGRVGKHRANGAKGTLGKGWPDLFLVKPGRSVYIECKIDGEQLTEEQKRVHRILLDAGYEVYTFRPSDFAQAMHVLAAGV